MIGLRWLSCKLEELLALTMSMPEEQAQELRVNATGGARDGRHKCDTMVISLGILMLFVQVVVVVYWSSLFFICMLLLRIA